MAKKKIDNEIFKTLIEDYNIKDTNDIKDMLKDLLSGTIQTMLEAEIEHELGYAKHSMEDKATSKLGPKDLKDFNNVKKMGATITYNPGYTWLIPLEKVRDYLSKIPKGLKIFNDLKKEVFKLKSKRKK